MTTVIDIQSCTDPDAPQFAFDLVGRGGRCSLAGSSYQDIVRWCYALDEIVKVIKPVAKTDLSAITSAGTLPFLHEVNEYFFIIVFYFIFLEGVAARNSPRDGEDAKRWYRYSYTFPEQGPLMLNVVGLTDQDANGNVQSHWLLVTSFARFQDGRLGAAEKSGMIKIKDYIVGVNSVDLTVLPYHDAMSAMRNASFPKTVHFLRDLHNKQETIYLETWAYSFFSSLNRRRKRYLELDSDSIHFRKPTQGGSTSIKRDSFFTIDQISYIRPLLDMNYPEDSQYLLRLVCNPGSTVQLVGNDDLVVGSIPIETLDLYYSNKEEMENWCKFLSNSSLRPRKNGVDTFSIGDIHVTPFETLVKQDTPTQFEDILGIRSYVTGTFAPREFSITEDGFLFWRRIQDKRDDNVFRQDRGRKLLLANDSICPLRAVYAAEDEKSDPAYRYQLLVQDIHQMVWIGMSSEELCMKWVNLIKAVIDKAPEESRSSLTLPDSTLPLEVVMSIINDSPVEDEPTDESTAPGPVQRNRSSSMFGLFAGAPKAAAAPAEGGRERKGSFFSSIRGSFYSSKPAPESNPTSGDNDEIVNRPERTGSVARGRTDSTAARNRQGSVFGVVMRQSVAGLLNLNSVPVEDDPTPETVQGYMYYKHKSKVKKPFSRYWFSLKGYKLYYYRERVVKRIPQDEGDAPFVDNNRPLGYVDLMEVLEAREAQEVGAPENSIELVTPTRPYLLVAIDEDQCYRWLDALSETLEMRKVQVQQEPQARNLDPTSNAEKINALKKTILFEGGLSKKNVNKITSFVTWKPQYFVISGSSLLVFDKQSEVFMTEKYKELVSIPAIRLIESSDDPSCNPGCAFNIHAYVIEGGNKDGMRIFTFEAQTLNLCKEWMTQLCNATGSLVLKPRPNGDGFTSVVNDQLRKKKDNYIKRTGAKFVVIEKDKERDYEEIDALSFKKPYATFKPSEHAPISEVRKTEFFNNNAKSGRGGLVLAGGGGGRGGGGRGGGYRVENSAKSAFSGISDANSVVGSDVGDDYDALRSYTTDELPKDRGL